MISPCSLSRAAAVLLAIVAALSMGPWLAPAGAGEVKAPAPSAALKALGILDRVPFQDAATAEKMMKQLAALGAQGDAGNSKEAARIYRTLWKQRTDPAERHVRCAAILGLANSQGIDAMDELVAAMNSADLQIRAAATQAAVSMPGEDVTKKWVVHLESVSADAKPGIISLLAARGGEAALGTVLDAMKDRDEGVRDEAVRLAAIDAATSFSSTRSVLPLVAFLASKERAEHEGARQSLERIPGDEASAAIASALGAAAPEVRRDLLGVLTVRGARQHSDAVMAATKDRDKGVQESALRALEVLGEEKHVPAVVGIVAKTDSGSVRGAAEKALGAICGRSNRDNCVKSILLAMAGAGVDAKCALIRILGKAPSPKGLDAVRAALKGRDARIQDAAVRALSEWPSRAVAPDLLQIARSGRSRTQQVLALRGFVRLVKEQKFKNADKVAMYKSAMFAAKRPDEKKMILSALGEVKDIAAVKLIAASLGDAALREEAAAAAVRIGRDFRGDVRREPLKRIIVPTMQKVLEISKNKNVRRDAERVLKEARRK